MSFVLVAIVSALLLQSFATGFVASHAFHRVAASKVACQAVPLSILSPSLLLGADTDINPVSVPSGIEDAFTDEIVLMDPTIRLLLTGFGVVVVLAIAAKFFLSQMDSAIEKVLVEFETTMRRKYASRWVSIEAKLDGLVEPERAQRLFSIMEELNQSEPDFMAKVNRDMGP